MNEQEVIENFRMYADRGLFGAKTAKMHDLAIKALEKQIPKKPKIIENKYSKSYTCPCCDLELIKCDETGWFAGRRNAFCYDCGQKLDWTVEV